MPSTLNVLCLFAVVAVAAAADEEEVVHADWKRGATDEMVIVKLSTRVHTGVYEELDDCLDKGTSLEDKANDEDEDAKFKYAIQYNSDAKVCDVYSAKPSKDQKGESNTTKLYVAVEEPGSSDGLSAGAIVATIILCVAFGLCLVALAIHFNTGEQQTDISKQMEQLDARAEAKEAKRLGTKGAPEADSSTSDIAAKH